jgi:hypothetical protein
MKRRKRKKRMSKRRNRRRMCRMRKTTERNKALYSDALMLN